MVNVAFHAADDKRAMQDAVLVLGPRRHGHLERRHDTLDLLHFQLQIRGQIGHENKRQRALRSQQEENVKEGL
jgi:hypothetical protein